MSRASSLRLRVFLNLIEVDFSDIHLHPNSICMAVQK